MPSCCSRMAQAVDINCSKFSERRICYGSSVDVEPVGNVLQCQGPSADWSADDLAIVRLCTFVAGTTARAVSGILRPAMSCRVAQLRRSARATRLQPSGH
jgi:hypothetical protein